MFEGWDEFYLLLGGSAGALIGLLFVVVTLTSNLDREQALRGSQIYMTPTVVNFCAVVVLSALALAPRLAPLAAGLTVLAAAAGGVAYAITIMLMLRRPNLAQTPHWTDFWFYGFAPFVLYLGLAIAGGALLEASPVGAYVQAGALIGLLLSAIRNAWDLVTWLTPTAEPRNADGSDLPVENA